MLVLTDSKGVNMNLGLAIFSGLLYAVAIPGYGLSVAYKSPVTLGLIYGLLFGDVTQGLVIGGSIQLLYLGVVATGNNIPTDAALAAIIALPIALSQGLDASVAVSIAVPFGILGAFFNNIKRSINIWFLHYSDRKAEELNIKEINKCAVFYPWLVMSIIQFVPVFIISYLGPTAAQFLLEYLPTWVTGGLSVAGGVLPAIGFALMITQIGRKEILPYFFIAYFMVQYLGLNTMAISVFGVCLAVILFFAKNSVEGGN